ncbi:MAG: hypothetical protein KKF44_03115 [Nanoarchaeota archaeon]|nr:hypothetical protein [Nanoarchaeota archaeon]
MFHNFCVSAIVSKRRKEIFGQYSADMNTVHNNLKASNLTDLEREAFTIIPGFYIGSYFSAKPSIDFCSDEYIRECLNLKGDYDKIVAKDYDSLGFKNQDLNTYQKVAAIAMHQFYANLFSPDKMIEYVTRYVPNMAIS